ncbi:cell wall metabolism sensor histidine kinase WalK [Domibacillus sp. DTU_2020_1001157_1_SI_ALB_TIR_016]|uniref:cell wall metabolism sensor histidine kinase WalK n=1 Tax=Domibacillus sp. DTU_2020_1001157_1_SI_ALB_TIR_016 TaxID=3077789 RepID=UPI0028E26E1F|nr:cell wall metabolism sensor histidine kinase WalK [Domibacillus sp. DTU_2020_1001157_1_SI_ALB_TIR_016]WNS80872.1 cell wall metabolism sensor histidine kinase WalK [Domibacillus sp. DTU_2020_1001157_1_SI_ALB_TIR_016]
MKRVGFFRSIQMKFVLIYVLLILFAMQIISVYFVNSLEEKFTNNFKESLAQRVELLEYNVREEILKERDEESKTLEQDVRTILEDFSAGDVIEVRVIDVNSRIIGTSDSNKRDLVGQRMPADISVKRALSAGATEDKMYVDENNGKRVWVRTSPILSNSEVKGAIYLVADIETVYGQLDDINEILFSAAILALAITAVLGITLARTITRPITDMRRQAVALGKGNFSRKVKVYGQDEIGELAVTFNNLTKRLQEAQATTEGERRKLSSVLSYMTDGVIATDRRGRVILINEPASKMLNVSRETVISQPIVSLLNLEEDYSFDDLLNEQDSVILDYSTHDRPYVLRANFSVIQKETGFVNGLITVLHDITEQEKIEMERREFVTNVSHELRTPLTTMRSYLEALAEGAWQDPDIAPNFLEVTQTETERMIRLVNDLLQLSKFDSQEYNLMKKDTDFIEFFNKIIDRFEMTKSQEVTFRRKLPRYPIYVTIDQDKLTQVIDNIISNALKYSPEGGLVSFKVEEHGDTIQVSISDQGMGIPKKSLERIFERFYRVDRARSRKMGGTGLGLAIAKELITAHGGHIWATSVEGKGTTIFFTLPADLSEEDDWE